MARQITNLADTTELEALNEMLAVIGEAPVLQAELDTPTQADVTLAVNTLKDVTRQVLSMGWRFSTEWGYEIGPETPTFDWVDTAGVTTVLNVFLPPSNLVAWEITKIPKQQGTRFLDTELRISRKFGDPTFVPVFYDRKNNRDGFVAADYPFLYINPTWYIDFLDTPEVFRRYCTIRAARVFQERTVGSQEFGGCTQDDEFLALRNLKREQGQTDDYNIFNQLGVLKHVGHRHRKFGASGLLEDRDTAGIT